MDMEMTAPIVDSALNFEESIAGLEIPTDIQENLELINVLYISFDDLLHQGQLVVHKDLAANVRERFAELRAMHFPIQKAVPIVQYGWDDEASMQDNNTSAFNYRAIYPLTQLSNHSTGCAIDINPLLNPCTASNGVIQPLGAVYDISRPGTLIASSKAVATFIAHGWEWLGARQRKDWQHFQKGTPQQ